MFTGIIEALGTVGSLRTEGSNVHFTIETPLAAQLKVDQSLAHNGVCLTVVACDARRYTVTAVRETLERSNLSDLRPGDRVNLERALAYNGRMDGHLVQGHVDTVGICTQISDMQGSWHFRFEYQPNPQWLLVDKGSIAVNGVSLTVVRPDDSGFEVAVIPYTYEHTNFNALKPGSRVNLEFDIIGKYMARYARQYASVVP